MSSNHTVRVSDSVHEFVEKRKPKRMSWDLFLRRAFGLSMNKKTSALRNVEPLSDGYVLPSDIHHSLSEARGAAITQSVRGKKDEIEKPIRMREVV